MERAKPTNQGNPIPLHIGKPTGAPLQVIWSDGVPVARELSPDEVASIFVHWGVEPDLALSAAMGLPPATEWIQRPASSFGDVDPRPKPYPYFGMAVPEVPDPALEQLVARLWAQGEVRRRHDNGLPRQPWWRRLHDTLVSYAGQDAVILTVSVFFVAFMFGRTVFSLYRTGPL